ncbi:MAG: ATP-binding protein [Cyanobacteriota bacterium]
MNSLLKDLINSTDFKNSLENISNHFGYIVSLIDFPNKNIILELNSITLCKKNFSSDKLLENIINLYELENNTDSFRIYTSENNLIYAYIPVSSLQKLHGIILIGPVLFDNLNIEESIKEANKNNLDQERYIKCLGELPVITQDSFESSLNFISNTIKLYIELIQSNKNLQQEISDRLILEKKLSETQRKLENTTLSLKEATLHKYRFLSNITHEVRTPLNGILGLSQTLIKEYFGSLNQKQFDYICMINNSGHYLFALINDVIDITKIDSGTMDFEAEDIDFTEFISEIMCLMKTKFDEKNISLRLYIDKKVKNINGDRKKLNQIFAHLLSNAAKFTPENGNVVLNIDLNESNKIKIAITDSGIGIKEEDIRKVFDDFYQVNTEWSEQYGGAGIGLALSKRLVEMHKGAIGAHNNLGGGSTFWVELPV